MEIDRKIKKIIENIKDIEIKNDFGNMSLREDLNMSSLDILLLIIDIEKEFKININEDEIYNIILVNDLNEYIKNKLSQE